MNEQEAHRKPYSVVGAMFANHVLKLGEKGFSDWLVRSFGTLDPKPVPGYFNDNSGLIFSESFALVFEELYKRVTEIAAKAVRDAINRFKSDSGSYVGLYVLTRLAESLHLTSSVERIGQILSSWIKEFESSKPPVTRDDIIALREILECIYRLLLKRIARQREVYDFNDQGFEFLEEFFFIASWADCVVRASPSQRSIVPSLAPAYFLAVAHSAFTAKPEWGESYILKLLGGGKVQGEKFQELYEFSSEHLRGEKFPYNVDRIVDEGQFSFRSLLNADYIYHVDLVPDHNPFEKVSATHGVFGHGVGAAEYLEEMYRREFEDSLESS